MSFGLEKPQATSEENFKIAVQKLQEEKPEFGETGNTKEVNGKFWIMGLEVKKPEYDAFMDKVNAVFGEIITKKEEELDQAA